MMGSTKPARITGGDGIMDVLSGLVDHAEEIVTSAVGEEIEDQQERLRGQAEQHDQWRSVASNIGSWEDAQGNAAFGVPDDAEGAARAERAEYGGADTSPTGLMRMGVLSSVSDIGWSLTDRFRSEGL